jgi:hypothetical protein
MLFFAEYTALLPPSLTTKIKALNNPHNQGQRTQHHRQHGLSTSDHPLLQNDHDYAFLHATKLSDCNRCASSKPAKVVTAVAKIQPQSRSRVFLLPPEIQETVYGYVFVAKEPASHDQGMTIAEAQSAKPASDSNKRTATTCTINNVLAQIAQASSVASLQRR